MLHGAAFVCISILLKCLHNNANDPSFLLQRCGNFLHPIIFSFQSNSVVNPCLRLGFSEINSAPTSSEVSGFFCLIPHSFVHHLIDTSPLYYWFVGQNKSICLDNLIQKSWNPSQSFCGTPHSGSRPPSRISLYISYIGTQTMTRHYHIGECQYFQQQ